MKVIEVLKKKKTLSFEFFPPKNEEQELKLFDALSELKKFNPDFAAITYGAMGSTREKTFYWAEKIKKEFGIEPIAHLTCVAANKEQIREQIQKLWEIGVYNLLALRGDPPADQKEFVAPIDGFKFAKDLVSFVKEFHPQFGVGVAGYPESHPSTTRDQDIIHLKQKVDAGADYVVTQLFFHNDYFFDFIERAKKAGITVPILPGIMPITNLKQIKKMTSMCGANIPKDLLEKLEKHAEDKSAVEEIGIEHTISQCRELVKNGVAGLHFFVMNQSGPTGIILQSLGIGTCD